MILACALAGACAGLAGSIEVAAVDASATAALIAGYGYTGILIWFFFSKKNGVRSLPGGFLR